MNTATPRAVVFALGVACWGALMAACYVEEVPPPAYGYEPVYYDGSVVYYDDVGRPFYYANGAVVWISPAVPEYPHLVAHWRVYGPAYHYWYAHDGYRYRGYHRHR
jgi:hypothetical protein